MMENKSLKLEELAVKITDGAHHSPKDFKNGFPMLSVKDMRENGFDFKNCKRISEEDFDKLISSGCKPEIDDILIAKDGSVLKHIFRVKEEPNYVLLSSIAIVRPNKDIVEPEFLAYSIKNPVTKELILNNYLGGTGVPRIVLKDFKKIDFDLPPLPKQKAIASVLSSLDDKIDLLHQQNQTLEALAETLFRQWFIEEAKEDWEEIRIGDLDIYISDYVANGSFASLKDNVKLINDGVGYALFIRNTDLKSGFNQKVYVDEHSYNFLSKTKLYGGEIIISNVADVGSVHICPKFDIPMTLGNNVIMLKSEYNHFLYLFFNSNVGQDLMYGITSGSVQQKFNKTDFKNSKITIKDKNQLIDFHNYVSIYFDKIESNKQQIQTLTKLRDTLLPKLMSGEVRVQL